MLRELIQQGFGLAHCQAPAWPAVAPFPSRNVSPVTEEEEEGEEMLKRGLTCFAVFQSQGEAGCCGEVLD